MNFLDQILAADWITRLGWTLLHSLWQIALVTAVLALLLSLLRRGSANVRYLAACGGLTATTIVPMVTFVVLPGFRTDNLAASAAAEEAEEAPSEPIVAVPAEVVTAARDAGANTAVLVSGRPAEQIPATSPPKPVVASVVPQPDAEAAASETTEESPVQRLAAVLSPWMPWCVVAWFVGVFALSVWNLGGWIAAQRLKRLGTNPVTEDISRRLSTLAERSGINRSVAIMKSLMVEVPVVVGWLRPVILLPAGILTGLTPAELDAILAHELAHIRRHDYLVNLFQTVVETLFFYHPGVWWLSRRIRAEREHCCDDMAVGLCGNKIDYASALAAVEAGRATPKMAMAARHTDSSTLGRIRRVLGRAGHVPSRWGRSLAGGLITSAMIVALATCFVVAGGGTEEDASAAESKPADWAAAAAEIFPDWKKVESGRYKKADVGAAKASRLLLSEERRLYVGFPFAQAKAKYPPDKGPDDPNYRSIFSHIDIITFDEKADLPNNVLGRLPITKWEDTDGLFVKTVDLGTGLGRRWIVRTALVWQHQLRTELKLAGGDDPIQLLVEGLLVKDAGLNAHGTPVLDTRRTARNVVNPLTAYGDKAVTCIERQIAKPHEPKDLAYLMRPLAVIQTEAADNLLKVLYEDPTTRTVAGDTLIGRRPRKGMKPIYLDMLRKRRHITFVGEVCVRFNWQEAVEILRDVPAAPNNWWSELEPSLTTLHKLGGKPREETKAVCLDLLKQRRYIGSVDKVCVMFNWQEAAPILREMHATSRNWNELESSFAALRELEGRPIPEPLTRARNDLSPYNLAETGAPMVEQARKIILDSPDRQAAALIATRLAHLRGIKASGEMIDASNHIGRELLMKMGDDAKPLLKIVIDNFSDDNTRRECQKTWDVISGRTPSDDSSDELPARTTPAVGDPSSPEELPGDPFAKNPGTTIPPTTPKAPGKEEIAWGETVDGLQAGLTTAFEYPRPYKPGTNVPLKFLLRNTTEKPITLTHARVPVFINWKNYTLPPGPQLLAPDGKQVFPASGVGGRGLPGTVVRTIGPGEVITMTTTRLPLRPGGWKGTTVNLLTYLVGPGKHQVSLSYGFGDAGGKHWGGTVTTGALDLYVHAGNQPLSPPGIAWGKYSDGVRCRLNVGKARLRPGEPPILMVDLQNHHTKRTVEQIWHGLEFKLEVDGKWTGKISPMAVDGPVAYLTPGQEWINVPLVLQDNSYFEAPTSSTAGGPAKFSRLLGPGRHTIRVDVDGVVSNPVEIEIVPDLPDGVYRVRGVNSTESGVQVPRSDAEGTLVLLHRLTENFGTASMASIANDNSRFRVGLHGAGPFSKGDDVGHFALWIDGLCVMVESHSNLDEDRRMHLGAWLHNREIADKIAASLKVTPALRKHPGHKMAASFSPTKKAFKPGEPIVLNMEITNVGDGPFSFVDGGRQRGPRNNQFGFTAFRRGGDGAEVPDTGDPENWGGKGSFKTLKPGEVFEKQVDITKWFDLAKPDTYKINCRFEMEISDNWDDVAQGTTLVVVADQEGTTAKEPAWGNVIERTIADPRSAGPQGTLPCLIDFDTGRVLGWPADGLRPFDPERGYTDGFIRFEPTRQCTEGRSTMRCV